MRREPFSRSIRLGSGSTRTCATSPSRTTPPEGVSMGSSLMLATLARVAGVLQTTTS